MRSYDRRVFLKGSLATVPALGLTACGLSLGEPEDEVPAAPITRALSLQEEGMHGPFGGNGQPAPRHCFFWCTDPTGFGAGHYPSATDLRARGRLARVKVWSGNYIDGIELAWRDLETNRLISSEHYGGFGGRAPDDQTTLFLDDDEQIDHIQVRHGKYVDQLVFSTTKRQVRSWGRDSGRTNFDEFHLDEGRGLHGLSGLHGKYIDSVVFWTFRLL
jgi:hypothetical protein